MRMIFAAAAAIATLAAPATAAPATTPIARANPATQLSIASRVRAGAESRSRTRLAARGGTIAAVLAAGVIIGGIVLITAKEEPDSL